MKHIYAPTFQAVKTAHVLEDAVLDGAEFVEAQVKLACMADTAYERIQRAAQHLPTPAGYTTKEAAAIRFVDAAMQLFETHLDTGVKVAADPQRIAGVINKLASAVMVDEVITEQLPMLEGATKVAAEECRRLGREFVMSLLGELLE